MEIYANYARIKEAMGIGAQQRGMELIGIIVGRVILSS
jgi:hypothetical protein